MLSAFSARPIIELRPRDKSKIETILAYGLHHPQPAVFCCAHTSLLTHYFHLGDRVLVGLNSGALRVYRLNDPTSNQGEHPAPGDEDTPASPPNGNGDHRPGSRASDRPTDLLREVEKFSTRAIEQLAIIREANIIVSLSNYQVSLHDRQTYELIETLSKSKNASCFAVTSNVVEDPDSEIPEIISRLAVAVKRRLLLWSWHQSELSDDVAEFVLPESIRSVTWVNANKLICGMNGGFVLVDVATQELQDIISPGSLGTNGQGSRFGSISSASMGYMGLGGYTPKPLAARLANGEVLLAKDINTLFVDDSGKPKERAQVPWTAAPESIGYSYPYILALQAPSKGSLEVRNPDTLSLLQTVSLPGAAQLHFPPPTVSLAHTAKNFHISSERCIWKMGSIDYDTQVQELVQGGHFDEAISILNMLEDALLKDKTETLREVKMQKAEMLFKKKKYRKSLDLFNEDDVHAPPERVLKLYPPHISGELSAWATQDDDQSDGKEASPKKANGTRPSSPDAADHPSSPTNVGGFAKLFMGGGHKRNQSDAASITSSKKEGAETEDNESIKEPRKSEEGPLEGKDLMDAVKELGSYLVGTRTRLQRIIDPVTGKLKRESIDSANGEDDIEKFLRITPTESEKEREQEILKMCKLVDTTLFRAYMFSSPTLAGSLFRLPNFCDPEVVNEKLLEHSRYTQLVDFFYGKKLHKEALDLLQRFGAATKPDPAAPTLHGPDRTIQYLQNLPPSESELILKYSGWTLKANPDYAMEIFIGDTENAETLPRDRVLAFLRELDPKLELQYLVHIIDELDDATPDFHNRLVELYVKNLKEMKRDDQWHEQMARFVKFLQESRQVYSLSKAFGLIPKEGMLPGLRF